MAQARGDIPMRLRDRFSTSVYGLVIDWRFHRRNRWVCALSPYLVEAIVETFKPIVISSQSDYDRSRKHLRFIIAMEPGWAAPRIRYSPAHDCVKAVFYSDPHTEPQRRYRYLADNGFDYVFSYYWHPFLRHFPKVPLEKVIHLPWAIPDHLMSEREIELRGTDVGIFGARNNDAYDVRNWCRRQEGVTSFAFSGVENKEMSDEQYFSWLASADALIAAGSSDERFDLVTPKYFEIAASGALLFGQHCKDLPLLGFDQTNAVPFTKDDFVAKLHAYRQDPRSYLSRRHAGRELIRRRHLVSHRIARIREVLSDAQA
jgi:hypothetical protein